MRFRNTHIVLGICLLFIGCASYKKSARIHQLYIEQCADSLENVLSTNVLPQFLYDSCLDCNKSYWVNLHSPISIRNMIINKVTNKKSLEYILKLEIVELSHKCHCNNNSDTLSLINLRIPHANSSFKELLQTRYEELNK